MVESNLLDHLLGRSNEKLRGIYVDQDPKSHSVGVKVEVNVHYGVSIPLKSEEIQKKVVEAITDFTGLHVSCVHVIFKSVVAPEAPAALTPEKEEPVALVEEIG